MNKPYRKMAPEPPSALSDGGSVMPLKGPTGFCGDGPATASPIVSEMMSRRRDPQGPWNRWAPCHACKGQAPLDRLLDGADNLDTAARIAACAEAFGGVVPIGMRRAARRSSILAWMGVLHAAHGRGVGHGVRGRCQLTDESSRPSWSCEAMASAPSISFGLRSGWRSMR